MDNGDDVAVVLQQNRDKVDALIEQLKEVLPQSTVVGTGPLREIWLYRFLVGFKWDVKLAADKFRNMVAFRVTNGVDAMRREMEEGMKPSEFPGFDLHQDAYQNTIDLCSGRSRNGCPIEIEATPNFDFESLFKIDPAAADRYLVYCMEYHFYLLDTLFLKTGRYVGYVKIMDLAGIKMSQLPWVRKWQNNSAARKERLSVDIMECYPECFSKVLVVNAPSFFAMIWKLIKPFIPPRTSEKVGVHNNVKPCLEHIDAEVLPKFLGGSYLDEWRMRPEPTKGGA